MTADQLTKTDIQDKVGRFGYNTEKRMYSVKNKNTSLRRDLKNTEFLVFTLFRAGVHIFSIFDLKISNFL